jgi:hypothetical protein
MWLALRDEKQEAEEEVKTDSLSLSADALPWLVTRSNLPSRRE